MAFIAKSQQFLPELCAYENFFSKNGWNVEVFRRIPSNRELEDFGVEWHIMGIDVMPKTEGRIKIHEYTSVSMPPLPRIKNRVKKYINVKPDYRIFQSQWVANEMMLWDTPYIFRDMGVDDSFFVKEGEVIKKEFDFVYVGSLDRRRRVEKILQQFLQNFNKERMLIIGHIPNWLRKMNSERFVLKDPLQYSEIPFWLKKADFGLNIVPDIYPYNQQTSTKLLEYCAAGLKIVTIDCHWAREFEREAGGKLFFLDKNDLNFNSEAIHSFSFKTPNVNNFSWDNQFDSKGFKRLLNWLLS